MIITFIKYFAMIVCAFYACLKLLHIYPKKNWYFSFTLFISLILPTIYLLRKYASPLTALILVLLFTLYLTKTVKTPFNLSLPTSVIAFGISYFMFLLSTALMSVIGYSIFLFNGEYPPNLIIIIFICLIQFLCTAIPFKIRRFKNGMPTLKDHGSSDNGVYISVLVLLAASSLSVSDNENFIFIIPFFFTFLCGLTLLFWWRSSITKRYMEKIKAREIEELQKIIQENNMQIEQLKHHNDELSKIIHKDNKLIPAMEYAVREYLSTAEHDLNNSIASARGKELLDQLACLTQERTGILTNYEAYNKKLTPTNVPSFDTLLSYMSRKAREHQINLDVTLSGSIAQLTKEMIEEADLRTLLADLIDNAIIASKKSSFKNILLNMGVSGDLYSIDIFDSGELFKPETLSNIGIMKTTTHANEGGSGIGLMTTFEIIKKYQASFIIEELPNSQLFTKKVSICFDQLGQFRIKTSRKDVQKSLSNHTNVILLPDSEYSFQRAPSFT